MSVDIVQAISDGFDRTLQRNGLMLAGLMFIVSLLNTVVGNSFMVGILQSMGAPVTQMPALTLPLSTAIAGILWLPVMLISVAVTITAVRTLVSSETEGIPEEYYRRNMPMAILNLLVGGIIFGLIVGIGFIFLVIPGLFLLTALYFWTVFVAVEDQNFIEGLQNSWSLTEGNRLKLFLLGVAVVLITLVISLLFSIVSMAGLRAVGSVIATLGSAFGSVFTIATMAQAYNQLK